MNEHNVLKRISRYFSVIILCMAVTTTAVAQTPKVTVDARNVSIKELLQRIEANSQYTFAYVDAEIKTDKIVSVTATNRSIASIIAEVLPGVNMEVKGLKIILTRARGGEPAASQAVASRTVKGLVTNENGDPIVGATVILKGSTVGAATNLNGEYAIEIRQNNATLIVSLIGYNRVEVPLSDSQTLANVTLKTEAIAMDDIVVDEVVILGKVIGLVRSF